ncbi:hypothetical protein IGI04_038673 [Brassica rapa subsp. trilocularis]|uniref:Pentacotripeptide-repeat region of PRORP domain-containing protein n=1 Tax=Brassica rapa subsp. trilocularis TaxID=1813537 RepID=A0ABQ7LKU1_BRACM|nr:hypothetical protein IGI04_038673 [Brassica rapa subsp. trilocularis]
MGLFPIWLFSSHVREGLIRRARRFYVVVTQSISHSEKVEKEGQFKVKALEINETGERGIFLASKLTPLLSETFVASCRRSLDKKLEQCKCPAELRRMGKLKMRKLFFVTWLKAGVEPDDVAYAALINGCCKNKCEDKAYNLIHEIVEKGMTPLEPCMDLYVKLIGEMVGNGMMAPSKACMDLHVLIHEMVEKGMTPPKACMATYVILRQEMVAPSEPCMDLHVLIHEMVEKGMTPLPEACKELFVVLIEDMVENEVKPPHEACKHLYVIFYSGDGGKGDDARQSLQRGICYIY